MNNSRLTLTQYIGGIRSADRIILSKAITLVESNLPADQTISAELIKSILPLTGKSIRIGITGAPGVGKSTFIEAFGNHLVNTGKKIAILTIDPSSQLTKGSILGDKTRMESLARNQSAYIRPTASGSILGGLAHKTREAMLLCEAAGFDVIMIETVGVGQSEVTVRSMVDFFLLLMLAGGGDELQGIKKGIMEMADAIVITKADGVNIDAVLKAQADFQHALHLFPAKDSGWVPPVITTSALGKKGIDDAWKIILKFYEKTMGSGFFEYQRSAQQISWFKDFAEQILLTNFQNNQGVQKASASLQHDVESGNISAIDAAQKLISIFYDLIRKDQ